MSANPDQLTANGSSSAVIEATLRDQNGSLVRGVNITFDLIARGAGNFSDIGVLSRVAGSRPVPGGPRPGTVSVETNGNGVARARYWAPFRTDQENDIVVTITGRPTGNSDFRDAIFRQVDIFLRAANRPMFPGDDTCSILVEPTQSIYDVGQLIFFTATQIAGAGGFPIARYEWEFDSTDVDGDGDTEVGPAERNVAFAFDEELLSGVVRTYVVRLTTTESQSGIQTSCTVSILVTNP